jgi:hypothetical protein
MHETFTKYLPCKLSDIEKVTRGRELASKMEEREQVQLQAEEAKSAFKTKTQGLDAQIDELKRIVLDGSERREIECFYHKDFENSTVITIRTDTGEEVDSRRMTVEERQEMLPLVNDALKDIENASGKRPPPEPERD